MEVLMALAPLKMLVQLVPFEVHVGLALVQVLAVLVPLEMLAGLVPPEMLVDLALIGVLVAQLLGKRTATRRSALTL
jgi:hypothetical protein